MEPFFKSSTLAIPTSDAPSSLALFRIADAICNFFSYKVVISVIDGYSFVEHLSWDAFNEGITLIEARAVQNAAKTTGVSRTCTHEQGESNLLF